MTNGIRHIFLTTAVCSVYFLLSAKASYSQEKLFESARPSEIILVFDDSPSEFEKSLSIVRQIIKSLSEDDQLKGEVNLKILPYSFQFQRPRPSLARLKGSMLQQRAELTDSFEPATEDLKIYDGLRSLEILLQWEKLESLGLFEKPKNNLIFFVGKTRFDIKPKIDTTTGFINHYQVDPYVQGVLSNVSDLLLRSPNAKNYSLIFYDTHAPDLIPVRELSLLAAVEAKANGFPDLRGYPRLLIQNLGDVSHLMKDLSGLMWDENYVPNLQAAAIKKWEAEQQRNERLKAERERSQIEQQVENRYRLPESLSGNEPRDLSYQDQVYLVNTDLPVELVPLSRFDYVYRFYPATNNGALRLEIRRENYYLDYNLVSRIDELDPDLLEKITGKNIHKLSVSLEASRAQADAEFFKRLFEPVGVLDVKTKALEGTDTFTHLIDFPKTVSLEQAQAVLRDYVASPSESVSGRGLFDQALIVDELVNRPVRPGSFVARDGDASRISVESWESLLGIPKNRLHPTDMNLVYDVDKVSTGLLGLGQSYQELVIHYSKPVLDVRVYKEVIKKDPQWLRKRTDYSWAEIMEVFERERMIGTQARPSDGELDFFVHLFESQHLKILGTQTSPESGIFRIRFTAEAKKEPILSVMENYAKVHNYRDVSALVRTAADYVALQKKQSDLKLRQAKMLSPEARLDVEAAMERNHEQVQHILDLLKSNFTNCHSDLEN